MIKILKFYNFRLSFFILIFAFLVFTSMLFIYKDHKDDSPVISNTSYTNSTYKFSAVLPEGFAAREFEDAVTGADTVVFENDKGEAIQTLITPMSEDYKILTVEMVKTDVPNLKIEKVESVEIGDDYRGLAFESDSPAFGGASREVWFVFKSNLYQISTYKKFDHILKSIFATWQFNLR